MSKVIIISDAHLIHIYHSEYDKIAEFRRFVKEFMEENPDIVLVLGDFFDKKLTSQSHLISHLHGSDQQIQIVDIIKSTKIPWYALVGNHEDEIVLKSIDQSTPNFHYMETQVSKGSVIEESILKTDKCNYWFSKVNVNERYKEKEKQLKLLCQAATKYDSPNKKNILLTHLDFNKRSETVGLEKNLIKILINSFNNVLNGHEHTYKKKHLFEGVTLVPPSIPTWITAGKGSILTYTFENGELKEKTKRKSPHGYLIFDETTSNISFKAFKPYMPSIEVHYDVTGKSLVDIEKDWSIISTEIQEMYVGKDNIEKLIIIPRFTGNMHHLHRIDVNHTLGIVANDIPHIFITEIRDMDLISSLTSIDTPEEDEYLNTEKVFEKVLTEVDQINTLLEEKNITISNSQIVSLVNRMRELDDNLFHKKGKKSISNYITELVENLLPEFNEILRMSYNPSDILELIETSFKRR